MSSHNAVCGKMDQKATGKLVELLDAWQDWKRSAIACSVELAQS